MSPLFSQSIATTYWVAAIGQAIEVTDMLLLINQSIIATYWVAAIGQAIAVTYWVVANTI
jgi:hypothetical protein